MSALSRIRDPKEEHPTTRLTGRGLLGTVADGTGLLSTLLTALALIWRSKGFVPGLLASELCVLCLIFLASNVRLQRRFAHESRRANNAKMLNQCHRHLSVATRAAVAGNEDRYAHHFRLACVAMSEYFSTATRHPCRVTVKDLSKEEPSEVAFVQDVARSIEPERSQPAAEPAAVADNTDFQSILDGAFYFFSNDLTRMHGYRNSSFKGQLKPHEYPYRSTIVWGIEGLPADPNQAEIDLIGFLCVDSEDARAFHRRLDVPAGRAIAHAMYSALNFIREARERAPSEE